VVVPEVVGEWRVKKVRRARREKRVRRARG